jgi:hypothetical protein
MRTAILGWPQVGKSSLFKMLCGPQAHPEAYGTHVGVARVPDSRLEALSESCGAKKTTYAAMELLDSPPLLDEPEKDGSVLGQVPLMWCGCSGRTSTRSETSPNWRPSSCSST